MSLSPKDKIMTAVPGARLERCFGSYIVMCGDEPIGAPKGSAAKAYQDALEKLIAQGAA